jgi:hypothetical protein
MVLKSFPVQAWSRIKSLQIYIFWAWKSTGSGDPIKKFKKRKTNIKIKNS